MSLFARNDAVQVNPSNAQIKTTDHGSDFYWAIFCVMALSTIVFTVMSFMTPRRERLFHYITIGIVATASVAYFTMAADLGSTPIQIEFANYAGPLTATRQVFYARYIDWFVTTPLLLLDLLLLAGLPWSTIGMILFADAAMVVTGLFGALVPSTYKWGYYVMGCAFFFYVTFHLVWSARRSAAEIGSDVHRLYIGIGVWTACVWTLYPVSWGLCEGGNVTSPDGEAVFYGVLDLLAKPVFGIWILVGHQGIGPERLDLAEKHGLNAGSRTDTNARTEKRHLRLGSLRNRSNRPPGESGHSNGINETTGAETQA